MRSSTKFLLGLFLSLLLCTQSLQATTTAMKSAVLHHQVSSLSTGMLSVLDHAHTVTGMDAGLLPRDSEGRVLLAMPDEAGVWQDSQGDLMDPGNQARVMSFLQSEEWARARAGSPNVFQRMGSSIASGWNSLTNGVKDRWDAITGREMRDAAGNIAASQSRLSMVSLGDVIGAVAFGLINGLLMGAADMFRDSIRAINSDPTCQGPMGFIKDSFKRALAEGSAFIQGVFNKDKREGAGFGEFFRVQGKFFLQSIGDVFLGLKDMCQLCEPLRKVFGAIFMMVLIGVIVTLVLILFPGLGLLVKIITSFLTLIFGIMFVVKTARKFLAALKDRSRQGTINLIEATCEFIGFLIAVFILAGRGKQKEDPKMKERYDEQPLSKKANTKYDGKTQGELEKLDKTIQSAKDKNPRLAEEVKTLKNEPISAPPQQGTVTFDKNVGRWRDAQGRFAKAPVEAEGLKWDPNVQRWRETATGKFAKAPVPSSNGGLTWDANVNRWRDAQGKFAKGPAAPVPKPATAAEITKDVVAKPGTAPVTKPGQGVVFDNRPQVQRWRDLSTGRFVKGPRTVKVGGSEIYWDGRPQVQRWREVASGRFHKGPAAVDVSVGNTDIYWDGRPQVMRWRERATGRFHKGPPTPPNITAPPEFGETIIRGVGHDLNKPDGEKVNDPVVTPPQKPVDQKPADQRPDDQRPDDQRPAETFQPTPPVISTPAPKVTPKNNKNKNKGGQQSDEVVRRYKRSDGDDSQQQQQQQDQQQQQQQEDQQQQQDQFQSSN